MSFHQFGISIQYSKMVHLLDLQELIQHQICYKIYVMINVDRYLTVCCYLRPAATECVYNILTIHFIMKLCLHGWRITWTLIKRIYFRVILTIQQTKMENFFYILRSITEQNYEEQNSSQDNEWSEAALQRFKQLQKIIYRPFWQIIWE